MSFWQSCKRCASTATILLVLSKGAQAGPWAAPGDVRLRHDLQVLSDYGLLNIPLTTWPVSFGDIQTSLVPPTGDLPLAVHAALTRVQSRLRRESSTGLAEPRLSAALAVEPIRVRGFQDTPEGKAELTSIGAWMGERFAWQLQATMIADPIGDDDDHLRFDGSYAGMALGNWMLSLSALPRWWGPGWDGSLILGTVARPVPALVLERNDSRAFDLPVLRWLGPWSLVTFMGQLDSDRDVPNAKLWGLRAAFKPTPKLEVAFARTAQWGGNGRPQDLDTFVELLAGDDNRGEDLSIEDEPGNQLAGADFRWRSPLVGDLPYAVYGQMIGEDEASGLPSREIGLLGAEHWGTLYGGSYRVYLEGAETTASLILDDPRYNYTYEHGIYVDGYRHYGLPLGHAIDNDSRMLSVGGMWSGRADRWWGLNLQFSSLNRDGQDDRRGGSSISPGESAEVFRILITHGRDIFGGHGELGLGAVRTEGELSGTNVDPQLYLRWTTGW